jgi:hypothetical protein
LQGQNSGNSAIRHASAQSGSGGIISGHDIDQALRREIHRAAVEAAREAASQPRDHQHHMGGNAIGRNAGARAAGDGQSNGRNATDMAGSHGHAYGRSNDNGKAPSVWGMGGNSSPGSNGNGSNGNGNGVVTGGVPGTGTTNGNGSGSHGHRKP